MCTTIEMEQCVLIDHKMCIRDRPWKNSFLTRFGNRSQRNPYGTFWSVPTKLDKTLSNACLPNCLSVLIMIVYSSVPTLF